MSSVFVAMMIFDTYISIICQSYYLGMQVIIIKKENSDIKTASGFNKKFSWKFTYILYSEFFLDFNRQLGID